MWSSSPKHCTSSSHSRAPSVTIFFCLCSDYLLLRIFGLWNIDDVVAAKASAWPSIRQMTRAFSCIQPSSHTYPHFCQKIWTKELLTVVGTLCKNIWTFPVPSTLPWRKRTDPSFSRWPSAAKHVINANDVKPSVGHGRSLIVVIT